MENKQLDQIIKQKLEQLEMNESSSNWNLMESILESEGLMENSDVESFDKIIKEKIQVEQPINKDASWLQMASTLDLIDNLDDLTVDDGRQFDEILKTKLGNTTVPLANDWDVFNEKLNNNLSPEETIDQITKTKLKNIPEEKPTDWDIMAAKLAEEQSFKRSVIYKYKVLESTVLVLLLFTFINFYPTYKEQIKSFLPNAAFFSFNSSKSDTETKVLPKKQSKNNMSTSKQSQDVNSLEVLSPDHYEGFSNGAIKKPGIVAEHKEQINISSTNYKSIVDVVDTKKESISTAKTFETKDPSIKENKGLFAKIFNKKDKEVKQNIKISSPKHLENISLSALDYEKNKRLPNFLKKLKKIPFGINTGMLMIGNYNMVTTPTDEVLNIGAYKTNGLGYGAGFTLGFQFDKVELLTGVLYKGFSYSPKGNEIVGDNAVGFYSVNINKININTIEIPIHINYLFLQNEKWSFSAGGGASIGLVFQANYFRSTETRKPATTSRSPDEAISSSRLYTDKIYRSGAFEGGSFNENQIFTADLSFGVEYKLNKRWNVFLNNVYQYSLPSNFKSPNNDKIHHNNIHVGMKVRLK